MKNVIRKPNGYIDNDRRVFVMQGIPEVVEKREKINAEMIKKYKPDFLKKQYADN